MFRLATVARVAAPARQYAIRSMSLTLHGDEHLTPTAFETKWKAYFDNANISAPEVRRGLNSVFANDLIPDISILTSAFKATRRVNDFSTSVRIFEGIQDKAQDAAIYSSIVSQLKPVIDELGLSTPEDLGLTKA